MTISGPLIANPWSLLLGAAAQLGIFIPFIAAYYLGFDLKACASIGIIGGADGPTAIYVTSRLKPELLGPAAIAAYSYIFGTCAANSASYYERTNNQKGKAGKDGPTSRSLQSGASRISHICHYLDRAIATCSRYSRGLTYDWQPI